MRLPIAVRADFKRVGVWVHRAHARNANDAVPGADDTSRRKPSNEQHTHRCRTLAAAVSELTQNPEAGVTQPSTCSWPVCAGLVLDFGPMFLFRVAAAFLATALFSSADFDAA